MHPTAINALKTLIVFDGFVAIATCLANTISVENTCFSFHVRIPFIVIKKEEGWPINLNYGVSYKKY